VVVKIVFEEPELDQYACERVHGSTPANGYVGKAAFDCDLRTSCV
jgi:hypothetical protein